MLIVLYYVIHIALVILTRGNAHLLISILCVYMIKSCKKLTTDILHYFTKC